MDRGEPERRTRRPQRPAAYAAIAAGCALVLAASVAALYLLR